MELSVSSVAKGWPLAQKPRKREVRNVISREWGWFCFFPQSYQNLVACNNTRPASGQPGQGLGPRDACLPVLPDSDGARKALPDLPIGGSIDLSHVGPQGLEMTRLWIGRQGGAHVETESSGDVRGPSRADACPYEGGDHEQKSKPTPPRPVAELFTLAGTWDRRQGRWAHLLPNSNQCAMLRVAFSGPLELKRISFFVPSLSLSNKIKNFFFFG